MTTRRKLFWWWLMKPAYRKERDFAHPAVMCWRLLWFPLLLVTAAIHCALILIVFGLDAARDVWHDCTGLGSSF